jgi:hypothetical protein
LCDEGQTPQRPAPRGTAARAPLPPLAWGKKVSPLFRTRCRAIAKGLGGATADELMTCMAWESGRTFSPSVRNAAGSGACGLIQFMPQTAAALGTTIEKLAAMSAEEQLFLVDAYFKPWRGQLRNLGDLYCAILWPAGIGKADSAVLFDRAHRPTTYLQNKGLDVNRDGAITRAEVTAKVRALLAEGLLPGNAA